VAEAPRSLRVVLPPRDESDSVRTRVIAAARTCVVTHGIRNTTAVEIAQTAAIGRATLYRHFPGGRDEVLTELIRSEQADFLAAMGAAVEGCSDVRSIVAAGLRSARHQVESHALLQKTLIEEPELLLPLFTTAGDPIRSTIAWFLGPWLAAVVPVGVDAEWAADEIARLAMSLMSSAGVADLDDDATLDALVDGPFLAWTRTARGSMDSESP
jgi:AcrR family transcriptional regulator